MNKIIKSETLNSMKERRSVRSYLPEQITEEELNLVIEAGRYAASGRGIQPVKFVVIQNREIRNLVAKWNAEELGVDFDPFYGAPTIVVVFSDKNRSTYLEDGTLALGNMMLGAYAIGLGSCWIHRAREVFSRPEGRELMKHWGLSDDYVGIGHCALGYAKDPLSQPAPRRNDTIIRV